jgi:hypothetical protein
VRKKIKKKIKKSYLRKFWDGDLSLPISYWLFGLVYSFIIGFVLVIITGTGLSERLYGILMIPWTIFWAVGCWRAADKYKGLMLWPVLSKISIVLSIIQGLASIVTVV